MAITAIETFLVGAGASATVATVGAAMIQGSVISGAIAAATGGDIGKAMLTGGLTAGASSAISGALGAIAPTMGAFGNAVATGAIVAAGTAALSGQPWLKAGLIGGASSGIMYAAVDWAQKAFTKPAGAKPGTFVADKNGNVVQIGADGKGVYQPDMFAAPNASNNTVSIYDKAGNIVNSTDLDAPISPVYKDAISNGAKPPTVGLSQVGEIDGIPGTATYYTNGQASWTTIDDEIGYGVTKIIPAGTAIQEEVVWQNGVPKVEVKTASGYNTTNNMSSSYGTQMSYNGQSGTLNQYSYGDDLVYAFKPTGSTTAPIDITDDLANGFVDKNGYFINSKGVNNGSVAGNYVDSSGQVYDKLGNPVAKAIGAITTPDAAKIDWSGILKSNGTIVRTNGDILSAATGTFTTGKLTGQAATPNTYSTDAALKASSVTGTTPTTTGTSSTQQPATQPASSLDPSSTAKVAKSFQSNVDGQYGQVDYWDDGSITFTRNGVRKSLDYNPIEGITPAAPIKTVAATAKPSVTDDGVFSNTSGQKINAVGNYVDKSGMVYDAVGNPMGQLASATNSSIDYSGTLAAGGIINSVNGGTVNVKTGQVTAPKAVEPVKPTEPEVTAPKAVEPTPPGPIVEPPAPVTPTPTPTQPTPEYIDKSGVGYDAMGNPVAPATPATPTTPAQYTQPVNVAPVVNNTPTGFNQDQAARLMNTNLAKTGSLDVNSVNQFVAQGYTPEQIIRAVDNNPNGGWANYDTGVRSMNPGSAVTPTAPVTPTQTATTPTQTATTPTQTTTPAQPITTTPAPAAVNNPSYVDTSGVGYDAIGNPIATTSANRIQVTDIAGRPLTIDPLTNTVYYGNDVAPGYTNQYRAGQLSIAPPGGGGSIKIGASGTNAPGGTGAPTTPVAPTQQPTQTTQQPTQTTQQPTAPVEPVTPTQPTPTYIDKSGIGYDDIGNPVAPATTTMTPSRDPVMLTNRDGYSIRVDPNTNKVYWGNSNNEANNLTSDYQSGRLSIRDTSSGNMEFKTIGATGTNATNGTGIPMVESLKYTQPVNIAPTAPVVTTPTTTAPTNKPYVDTSGTAYDAAGNPVGAVTTPGTTGTPYVDQNGNLYNSQGKVVDNFMNNYVDSSGVVYDDLGNPAGQLTGTKPGAGIDYSGMLQPGGVIKTTAGGIVNINTETTAPPATQPIDSNTPGGNYVDKSGTMYDQYGNPTKDLTGNYVDSSGNVYDEFGNPAGTFAPGTSIVPGADLSGIMNKDGTITKMDGSIINQSGQTLAPPGTVTQPTTPDYVPPTPVNPVTAATTGALVAGEITKPATTTGKGYKLNWGTPPTINLPGVNPGTYAQAVKPYYSGGTPIQSQYYWGKHPYAATEADLANYNNIPGAPAQPFGPQFSAVGGNRKLNIPEYVRQNITQGAVPSGYFSQQPQYTAMPVAPSTFGTAAPRFAAPGTMSVNTSFGVPQEVSTPTWTKEGGLYYAMPTPAPVAP